MKRFKRISSGFVGCTLLALPGLAAEQPGTSFHLKPSDLPKPFATPAVENSSKAVPRPKGAMPQVPPGFSISIFASGLTNPRWMALAPNGDVFLAEPDAGRVTLLHDGKASTFAEGFKHPHGLAFHDGALYVADFTAVWRLSYTNGAIHPGARTRVTNDGFGPLGGHATRDIAFDRDGALYVAIGSMSNVDEEKSPRATVQKVDAQGHLSTFASGTRNPVGIALYPGTNDIYVTVNERDGYGDGLVPDYLTRVQQGDFYGWPYAYTGPHPDPVVWSQADGSGCEDEDARRAVRTPTRHPWGWCSTKATTFRPTTRAMPSSRCTVHGIPESPPATRSCGCKFDHGRPLGEYQNFVTGFWDGSTSPAQVWGRPAGLLVAKDGSLLIADDVGKTIWRVSHSGK